MVLLYNNMNEMLKMGEDFTRAIRLKAVEDLGYNIEEIENNQKIVDIVIPIIKKMEWDEEGISIDINSALQKAIGKTLKDL